MDVSQAADRYRVDAAAIWHWITSERVVTSPEGERVQLRADEREPSGKWIVREVGA